MADELTKEAEVLAAERAKNAQLLQMLADHAKLLEEQAKENKKKQDEERRQRWSRKLYQLGLMRHDDATLEQVFKYVQGILANHVPGEVLHLNGAALPGVTVDT